LVVSPVRPAAASPGDGRYARTASEDPAGVGVVAHELITHGRRVSPSPRDTTTSGVQDMGSVIKKRRKRMAKKKHRKLLKKTRVQRRNKK
jgi:hypothetical protein